MQVSGRTSNTAAAAAAYDPSTPQLGLGNAKPTGASSTGSTPLSDSKAPRPIGGGSGIASSGAFQPFHADTKGVSGHANPSGKSGSLGATASSSLADYLNGTGTPGRGLGTIPGSSAGVSDSKYGRSDAGAEFGARGTTSLTNGSAQGSPTQQTGPFGGTGQEPGAKLSKPALKRGSQQLGRGSRKSSGSTASKEHQRSRTPHNSQRTQQQEAGSAAQHSSNNKCDDTTVPDGRKAPVRGVSAAAAAAGVAMEEDDEAGAQGSFGAIQNFGQHTALGDGGTEYDDDSEDESGSGSDDGDSDGEQGDGPDPAALVHAVESIGDGLALLHAKVDRLTAVVFGAMGAKVPPLQQSAAK